MAIHRRILAPTLSLFFAFGATACGGGPEELDAALMDGAVLDASVDSGPVPACERDEDCSDSSFCTGRERCVPGDSAADARGCVAGEAPCMAGQSCSEAMARCESDCDANPDADGDGSRAENCGGDDCDDTDPAVFAGAPEICDAEGRDEDCNQATLAGPDATDVDGDGFVSDACCNLQDTGALRCGLDCDDSQPAARFGLPEVCDGIDNDCDESTDEGVQTTYYRDQDEDLYGDDSDSMTVCAQPDGYTANGGDCDDTRSDVNPVGTETCDGADEDCDTRTDEDVSPPPATTDHCGACGAVCPSGYVCNVDTCEDGAVEVAAGRDFLCVRTATGDVYCYGSAAGWAATPTLIPGLGVSTDIEAGGGQACAIDDSNQVRCWGVEPITDSFRATPAAVAVPDGASLITVGGRHACAVSTTGATYCWGANDEGQIGNDTLVDQPSPVLITLPTASAISAGIQHTCVVDTTGVQVTCWGDNSVGQYGAGFVGMDEPSPASIAGVPSGTQVLGGGGGVSCAGGGAGLLCWGQNFAGQTGSAPADSQSDPASVALLTSTVVETSSAFASCPPAPPTFVATRNSHTCARTALGTVSCWGSQSAGALGDGMTSGSRHQAAAVSGLTDVLSLTTSDTSACSTFSCAAQSSGRVVCWGANMDDFLRTGTAIQSVPIAVPDFPIRVAP